MKADREVTPVDVENHSLVLVGTPRGNRLLARLQPRLPIRVEGGAVTVGAERHAGERTAAVFIHPNPENPDRYVVVHTGVSPGALFYTGHLPELVPDYVVFDASGWPSRGRRALLGRAVLDAGFFDREWQVAESP